MVEVDVNEAAKSIVLNVRVVGIHRFKARLWIARQFFKVGARIAGLGIKFEDKPFGGADL